MEHEHEHTHSHGHTHTHPHTHEHIHTHEHDENYKPKSPEEIRALLTYMIDHNDHHNEELADLLADLPEDARKQMYVAIGAFEAANVYLRGVLDCLDAKE